MEKDSENLILLHGALTSELQFASLKQELSNSLNVYSLNFSGHGGLPLPPAGYSLQLFEKDVLNFMDKTGIDAAHIFGYSMGGYVGLSLAGNFPASIKSVFTLATKFDWSPQVAEKEAALLNPEQLLNKVPGFAEHLRKIHHPADWKQVMQYTSVFMLSLGECHLEQNFFKTIKCPVRIAVGDSDKMVDLAESNSVFKFLTNGSLLVLPNTQHQFERVDLNRLIFEIKQFVLPSD